MDVKLSQIEDFEKKHKAWEIWLDEGEPGNCPMCDCEPGKAHKRNICFSPPRDDERPSPLEEAFLEMSEDERVEAMRPWEPWLVDIRWIRWIIADFMGLDHATEVDKAKVREWLEAQAFHRLCKMRGRRDSTIP